MEEELRELGTNLREGERVGERVERREVVRFYSCTVFL